MGSGCEKLSDKSAFQTATEDVRARTRVCRAPRLGDRGLRRDFMFAQGKQPDPGGALALGDEGGMQKQRVRILTVLGRGLAWGRRGGEREGPSGAEVEVSGGGRGREGGIFVLLGEEFGRFFFSFSCFSGLSQFLP